MTGDKGGEPDWPAPGHTVPSRCRWAALARTGDVPTPIEENNGNYPTQLVTVATLGHLFELFQDVAGAGDANLEPGIGLLGHARPGLTQIEIARYCEPQEIYDGSPHEHAAGLPEGSALARLPLLVGRTAADCVLLSRGTHFTCRMRVEGGECERFRKEDCE